MANANDKPLNVFTSFLPMFYVSKLLGIFPLSYVSKKSSSKVRIRGRLPTFEHSPTTRTYSVLFLLLFMGIFVITFRKAIDAFSVFGTHEVNIAQSEFVSAMTLAPAALSSLVVLYFAATSGRKLSKIFSTIYRLDRKITHPLVPRGVGPRHVWLRKIAIAQALLVPTMVLIQALADYESIMTGKESNNYLISFYVLRLISFTLEQQFVLVLLILRDRFGLVNEALRDLLMCPEVPGWQTSVILSDRSNQGVRVDRGKHWAKRRRRGSTLYLPAFRLKEIRFVHFTLSEETVSVNDAYQLPLLAIVLGLFFDVIAGGYFLLDDVISGSTVFISFFSSAVWVSFGSLRIILLSWVAWDTTVMAKKGQTWILKLQDKKTDMTLMTELKIFFDYFLQSKVQFNICGLFVLDMTVVQAIAQASTSYLLVLMQFRQNG